MFKTVLNKHRRLLQYLFIIGLVSSIECLKSTIGLVRNQYRFAVYSIPPISIIDPSYNLALGSAILGGTGKFLNKGNGPVQRLIGGASVGLILFGGFLAFQTTNLRFQFDATHFSLVKADNSKLSENIVVGGENSWRYDSFVNWGFLPDEDFPILVYFKETQTPKEKWVEAPIVVDSLPGQAHFFPAIANVQELKKNFIAHNCKKPETDSSIRFTTPKKLTL